MRVVSEVANFYPLLAGWGWWARIGGVIYRTTQYAIHNIVTNAFFRSLAALDLRSRGSASSARGCRARSRPSAPEEVDPPPRETEVGAAPGGR